MHLNRRHFMGTAAASALTVSSGDALSKTVKRQWFEDNIAPAWTRWWWPGGAVEDEQLRADIRRMKAAGYAGAEIQVFNPGVPNLTASERARLHDYANPAFFEHIKVIADEAAKQDFQIDYTFGSAWPSGGGFAITPELALVELTPAITTIHAPTMTPINITLPGQTKKFGNFSPFDGRNKDPRAAGWKERLAARHKLIAVIAFKGSAPVLADAKGYRESNVITSGQIDQATIAVLTEHVSADGRLDWTPPSAGTWQIVALSQFAVDSSVMAGVGEGPQLVLDHFSRAAFDAHAERVGGGLIQALGDNAKVMRASFVDSVELMQDLHWTENFLTEFRTRRGYDLTPYLPHILQPGWMQAWGQRYSLPYYDGGDLGEQVRHDYRLTLSDLLQDNFWQPFVKWNHDRGLKAKVQAHGSPGDVLKGYGGADIPETEDLESGGDTHFMRLARSAARIYGKPIVSAESFVWKDEPYDTPPSRLYSRANLLFASGVNQINVHGYAYTSHPEKWPGWFPFAPSAFMTGFSGMYSDPNPVWPAIKVLNGYMSRMQGLLQNTKSLVNVALYLGEMGYYHGMETQGRHEDTPAETLLRNGYDYDRINADTLRRSRVEKRGLITPGGAIYKALVLPHNPALDHEVATHLAGFARAGLPVIFIGAPPYRHTGVNPASELDQHVKVAVQLCLQTGSATASLDALARTLSQKGIAPNLAFGTDHCLFIEQVDGDRHYILLHNTQTQPVNLRLRPSARGRVVRWDRLREQVWALHAKDGFLHLSLEPGETALLAINDHRLKPSAVRKTQAQKTQTRHPVGDNRWLVRFDGHGLGGRIIQQERTDALLTDWRDLDGLADFSGTATYSTTFTLPSDRAWEKRHISLDLGQVHDCAYVRVNGHDLGLLIAPPFTVDITSHLVAGENRLDITIMNTLNNAMVNPKAPGFKALSPKPAGLAGPVLLSLES